MKVEDLPAVELSGLCSAMNNEELLKAMIQHSNWSWLTREKRHREKLADFITHLFWMDSRLLILLSFSENPSSLDGEQLLQAAKYAFKRNKCYKVFRNVFPRLRLLFAAPASMQVGVNVNEYIHNEDIAADERESVPWLNLYSHNYLLMPPSRGNGGARQEYYIYFLPISIEPNVAEEAEFVNHPLWRRLNIGRIRRSHLVEICFRYEIVDMHEMYFWNVVKAFASLMTSSQVLSIRVIYPRSLQDELVSFWPEMYARFVRLENAWLIDLPIKWILHLSLHIYGPSLLQQEWLCDLRSSMVNE